MMLLPLGTRTCALGIPLSAYICRQCLRKQQLRPPSSKILNCLQASRRYAATAEPPPLKREGNLAPHSATPLGKLGTQFAQSQFKRVATASSPETCPSPDPSSEALRKPPPSLHVDPKRLGYWLIGSAVSVFGIVVFGGLTRLTESGLSITEWKPVTGSLPPLSQEDWESEFEKYRASPEFQLLNSHMSLAEFKKIYLMEWAHRLWGRFIGLSFVLPTAYLIARKQVSRRLAWNLIGISGLICLQGFIGWWMVKSGLKDDLFAPGSHPRVSQYRLATHLATAFACYSWMLLTGLKLLREDWALANPAAATKLFEAVQSPVLRPLRRYVVALTVLVFVTVCSGALVAGLDAGLIYNEFPTMGAGLTPPASELWDQRYARRDNRSDLWWRNMMENPSLVQLDHRILATMTACAVVALFAYTRRGQIMKTMPQYVRKGINGLVHLVALQFTLGLCTLVYMVPTYLAAMHQAGAVALLTGALVAGHRLRLPSRTLLVSVRRASKRPIQIKRVP